MLFVSRYVGHDKVGIFDTDDNTEEVIDRSEAMSLAGKYRLQIKGIVTDSMVFEFGDMEYATGIFPYQDQATVKSIQTKARLLWHINVQMFGNMITHIFWEETDIRGPVTMRLSDFGTECADCILSGNEYSKRHLVTLVLDDKIKISPFTFECGAWGATRRGVKFDLREVTDYEKAKIVYATLMKSAARSETYNSVIDSDERKTAIRLGQ